MHSHVFNVKCTCMCGYLHVKWTGPSVTLLVGQCVKIESESEM